MNLEKLEAHDVTLPLTTFWSKLIDTFDGSIKSKFLTTLHIVLHLFWMQDKKADITSRIIGQLCLKGVLTSVDS